MLSWLRGADQWELSQGSVERSFTIKKKCQGNTCISYDIQISDNDVIPVYPMIYRSVIRM